MIDVSKSTWYFESNRSHTVASHLVLCGSSASEFEATVPTVTRRAKRQEDDQCQKNDRPNLRIFNQWLSGLGFSVLSQRKIPETSPKPPGPKPLAAIF